MPVILLQQIQSANDEAVHAFEKISTTISEIDEITSAIASTAQEQSPATAGIAQNADQALISTQQVPENIAEVSSAANETGASAETVPVSADNMNKSAGILTGEVRNFIKEFREGPLDQRKNNNADYDGAERRDDDIAQTTAQATGTG